MAHIIRGSLAGAGLGTWVVFDPNDDDIQAFFKRTRANPFTICRADWRSGTHIPPDLMPRRLKVTKGGVLRDWRVVRGGATLVSGGVKDCVEALEPSRHQFFPVTIEEKNGATKPGSWFIFNVVGVIDAIIEERSNLTPLGRKEGLSSWEYQRAAGPWECALDAAVVGDRACWTDLRYSKRWFVSDRLAQSLKKHKLRGFDLDDFCGEVSR